jgi:hypothetical protein
MLFAHLKRILRLARLRLRGPSDARARPLPALRSAAAALLLVIVKKREETSAPDSGLVLCPTAGHRSYRE